MLSRSSLWQPRPEDLIFLSFTKCPHYTGTSSHKHKYKLLSPPPVLFVTCSLHSTANRKSSWQNLCPWHTDHHHWFGDRTLWKSLSLLPEKPLLLTCLSSACALTSALMESSIGFGSSSWSKFSWSGELLLELLSSRAWSHWPSCWSSTDEWGEAGKGWSTERGATGDGAQGGGAGGNVVVHGYEEGG